MKREEGLEKIAWFYLKQLSLEDATELVIAFFKEPLKPSLREKLNLTAVLQWETHEPPPDLKPGNPIYRPILIEKMKQPFRGATNEYLADHLRSVVGVPVDSVEGELPTWLPCPACGYHTFEVVGDWDVCTVCGWNSDPVQEATLISFLRSPCIKTRTLDIKTRILDYKNVEKSLYRCILLRLLFRGFFKQHTDKIPAHSHHAGICQRDV